MTRQKQVRIHLYKNLDRNQMIEFKNDALPALLLDIEKWIRTHNDECDGLTVGVPDMNWYHVLKFIEGERYASMQWELETYYQGVLHENDVGLFAEMCEAFIEKCRDFWMVTALTEGPPYVAP